MCVIRGGGMEIKTYFDKLFIFEMANNHMGDVGHGLRIIREFADVCRDFDFKFAFKFQYRDLNTFIHPVYKNRSDIKYVKRFMETRLSEDDQRRLHDEARNLGFITICTPFDENSVDRIERHGYDIIKIGSCSFTDWPLLESIVRTFKPIIISTAGAMLEDIDRVVDFLSHREKNFCVMHCVGEYPTLPQNLQLNQISLLKKRYPEVSVGYSTHESPENCMSVMMAVAKGATVFEKHVGVVTEKYAVNAYSIAPEQARSWLTAAKNAYIMCGEKMQRVPGTAKERVDLRGLQRGVFAKSDLKQGERVTLANTFLAIPNVDHQIIANDLSKYTQFILQKDLVVGQPIMLDDVAVVNLRGKVLNYINLIKNVLLESKVALPRKFELDLSHHYGLDRFLEYGAAIVSIINREYCKKLIILLPNQQHPIHYHQKKEEAFHILFGDLMVHFVDESNPYQVGDIVVVERGMKHGFSSQNGAIFEEVSTTHYKDDSYYDDTSIMQNRDRKTSLTLWVEQLEKQIL